MNCRTTNRFYSAGQLFCLVTLCSLFASCGGGRVPLTAETKGQANFNIVESDAGYTMSASQLFDFVSQNRYLLSGGTLDETEIMRIVDSLLIDTLSGLAADTVNFKAHRLLYRDYTHQYQDVMIKKYSDSEIISRVSAYDSSEVLTFFKENPGRFTIKEQVRLWQILISGYGLLTSPDSTYYKDFTHAQLNDKAKEKIFQVYDLLKYGEVFQNLAIAFNQDVRSLREAGWVGWTNREVYYEPFDSVAFNLKVGEFSKPYLDRDGWHILYIDGYLPEGTMPIDTPVIFEQVRGALLDEKLSRRSFEVMDSLRQGLQILFNESIADSNIHRVDDETWCAIINGKDTVKAYVLKFYEEGMRDKYKVDSTNREQKMEMVKFSADRYLTCRAVIDRGMDRDSDLVAFAQNLSRAKSKQIVLNRQFDFDWVPSDPTIEAYYNAHLGEYLYEKPTTLQYMTVGDSTFAEFLHDQAITGLDLPDIMREFSANNPGGVLTVTPVRTVGSTDIPFEIWQAGVLTAGGGVSAMIKSNGNYVFVKVFSRKESRNLALAKGEILVKLQKEHQRIVFEQFRDKLCAQYGVRLKGRVAAITLEPHWIRNKKP